MQFFTRVNKYLSVSLYFLSLSLFFLTNQMPERVTESNATVSYNDDGEDFSFVELNEEDDSNMCCFSLYFMFRLQIGDVVRIGFFFRLRIIFSFYSPSSLSSFFFFPPYFIRILLILSLCVCASLFVIATISSSEL